MTAKTAAPPGGDIRDYASLAPYWWPDPASPDGLPYRRRDGVRFPPADAADSDRSDRTRLQRALRRIVVTALAADATGDRRLAAAAACCVRAWFLDPATAMRPHLRFAQMRIGHGREGTAAGVIDARALAFALDGVRLVHRLGTLDAGEMAAMGDWCRRLLDWLLASPQGQGALVARNNIGTWFEVLVLALAAFVDDAAAARGVLERAGMRIAQQIRPDGAQPAEAARTLPLHYALFNLEAWACLARMALPLGFDAWRFATSDGRSLGKALRRAAAAAAGEGIAQRDRARVVALARLSPWGAGAVAPGLAGDVPVDDDPSSGLPPFWQLVAPAPAG